MLYNSSTPTTLIRVAKEKIEIGKKAFVLLLYALTFLTSSSFILGIKKTYSSQTIKHF